MRSELANEVARLKAIDGLPIEFWNQIRVTSYRLIVAELEAAHQANSLNDPALENLMHEALLMYETHGPEKLVEISVNSVNNFEQSRDRMVECLQILAGPNAKALWLPDAATRHGIVMLVGPVSDFDRYVASIRFAEVVKATPEQRDIVLHTHEVYHYLSKEAAKNTWEALRQIGGEPYHAWLVKQLLDYSSPVAYEARQELARLDPEEITNSALRQKIADEFARLVRDPHAGLDTMDMYLEEDYRYDPDLDYTKEYRIWAGEKSQDFIVAFIEERLIGKQELDFDSTSYRPLWTLASYGNLRAAEQLIDYLDDQGDTHGELYGGPINEKHIVGEQVGWALETMGSMVEGPLLRAIATGRVQPSPRAFRLLSWIGTSKSRSLLESHAPTHPETARALEAIDERGGAEVPPDPTR